VRVLNAILERLHASPSTYICGIGRRDNLPNGAIISVTCFVCPSTPEKPPSQFKKQNPLRIFAEHFMQRHLDIAKPFACFSCGKLFSLGQVRDRHEQNVHHMYRPKAFEALLKKEGGLSVGTDNAQPTIQPTHDAVPSEMKVPQPASPARNSRTLSSDPNATHVTSRNRSNAKGLRSRTPVADHRTAPYPHRQVSSPVVTSLSMTGLT
jgi:hypothetical protein